jgi:hypothetical protein
MAPLCSEMPWQVAGDHRSIVLGSQPRTFPITASGPGSLYRPRGVGLNPDPLGYLGSAQVVDRHAPSLPTRKDPAETGPASFLVTCRGVHAKAHGWGAELVIVRNVDVMRALRRNVFLG